MPSTVVAPHIYFVFLGGRGNAKGFSKQNKRRSGKTGAKKGRGNVCESINISSQLCWPETLYCCHVFELATTSHYTFIFQDRKKKRNLHLKFTTNLLKANRSSQLKFNIGTFKARSALRFRPLHVCLDQKHGITANSWFGYFIPYLVSNNGLH